MSTDLTKRRAQEGTPMDLPDTAEERWRRLKEENDGPLNDLELEREIERRGLRPMLEEAEREGMWLMATYQDLWYTPDELREAIRTGLGFGSAIFRLRSPRDRLQVMQEAMVKAGRELDEFKHRMARTEAKRR